jgi:hypothetical protein
MSVTGIHPDQPLSNGAHSYAPHNSKGTEVFRLSATFNPFDIQVLECGSHRVTYGLGHICPEKHYLANN